MVSNGHSNGTASNDQLTQNAAHTDASATTRRPLEAGIYAPTMTFFDPTTEDLDLPSIAKHSVRLAKAGLKGLITMGSNGEAVHLSYAERRLVTQTTRKALDEAGFTDIPVIVGCSEQSIRGTVALCVESAEAGGEYVLMIPPSYYRAAMGNEEALVEYFHGVADGSPLPIILYNYPGAVAGIDMDSDLLIRISKHPNIIGTKFTCGNTGKLTRVALEMDALTPFSRGSGYMAFGGMADFTLQSMISGGSGIIAGGANVAPKACVAVFELFKQGKLQEAAEKQKVLSKGDWVLTKTAIPGTKAAIQANFGYGGYPRRPLGRLGDVQLKGLNKGIEELMAWEHSL
jgi:L-threo-3-deoxy-hexylosonate aldolase